MCKFCNPNFIAKLIEYIRYFIVGLHQTVHSSQFSRVFWPSPIVDFVELSQLSSFRTLLAWSRLRDSRESGTQKWEKSVGILGEVKRWFPPVSRTLSLCYFPIPSYLRALNRLVLFGPAFARRVIDGSSRNSANTRVNRGL